MWQRVGLIGIACLAACGHRDSGAHGDGGDGGDGGPVQQCAQTEFASVPWVSIPHEPTSFATPDVNGDGTPDLVVTGDAGVSVRIGNGDGSFSPEIEYPTGAGADSVAIADLDGDGRPDLAVANLYDDTLSVLIGNGDGTFQPKVDYPADVWPTAIAAVDLDGDGKLDLAVANYHLGLPGSVSVLIGTGDGTFGSRVDYPISGAPDSLAVTDLDGDGRPDLLDLDRR